ncbi:MAG TPA: hypothetical protein VD788_17365, partial [Candidatus Polarisedimenticolaceae bacterium]|nr:hypothetical protein [Candidatus Polarisedimenticolaceae bacterium]
VREDYSATGDAWGHFPHDHARSRAYRWNEDALGGFCNRFQNVCLGLALWNGRDPILKERLFGLSGHEGNHGEDAKELWYHLDGTPTHSYMKMIYRYPQAEFPYRRLVDESAARGYGDPEFELIDALPEDLRQGRFFDVTIEYAKHDEEDILCRVTAVNHGPQPAPLHLLPQLWFRNTWSWDPRRADRPELVRVDGGPAGAATVRATHRHLGERLWYVEQATVLLFTENETNTERLFGRPNGARRVKDGFHEAVVQGEAGRVGTDRGTKVAAHFPFTLAPEERVVVRLRFCDRALERPFRGFDEIFRRRIAESDEFYAAIQRPGLDGERKALQRRAWAGLLWSKQFYHYGVQPWLDGDAAGPRPAGQRLSGRNAGWTHLYNTDVLSMPDKWEYPWYAAWDLAFHALPLAQLDPEWAKRQLVLLLREWYQHPNGQLPAYEWNFGDVNPPVHAWAAWRVYKIARNLTGQADTDFLERVFHKLLLNFTWWVNRKDVDGRNVFQGGFLGMDNIGVFDRSAELPPRFRLEQSDGTAWMAMYCLNMLAIALELARVRPVYEDVATKFFEHFVWIAGAINGGRGGSGLFDEQDGFYYDRLRHEDGAVFPVKIRSFVGLIPLFAVETFEPETVELFPRFARRVRWFVDYRRSMIEQIASPIVPGEGGRFLLSLVGAARLRRILERMFDENQFLSPYGLRSLSREHRERPFRWELGGRKLEVRYDPAESSGGIFGGNSNWRGPVWFPVNYLMIESLQRFHHYYGDAFEIEVPSGSGHHLTLADAAGELARRLIALFLRDANGRRPFNGGDSLFDEDPRWRDLPLFHEYFDGDTGAGLGASHQTGWTALLARLIQQFG